LTYKKYKDNEHMKHRGFIEILPGIWYEKKTGLPWSSKSANNKLTRLCAKTVNGGYYVVSVNYHTKRWHRLVWEFFQGKIPSNKVVDHISNNVNDCRIANLQLLSNTRNIRKAKTYKHNTTGFPGVSKRTENKFRKYFSQIRAGNIKKHLGSFLTPEEAYLAYYNDKIQYHGKESVRSLPKPTYVDPPTQ
jgi:hypothetical protein